MSPISTLYLQGARSPWRVNIVVIIVIIIIIIVIINNDVDSTLRKQRYVTSYRRSLFTVI